MANVKFIQSSHQYFVEDEGMEHELISVSKFVDQFKGWKDWRAIATKYVEKNGHDADYWQKKWRNKGKKGTEAGTALHLIKERELIEDDESEFQGKKCARKTCTHIDEVKWSIPIMDLAPNTIYPELIVYDLDFFICGQPDKTIITDTHIHIGDYKTDEKIEFKGWSSQWKGADKLLSPLSHLDNCSGNIYALKMSLYMYMLWKKNRHLLPGDLFIERLILKRNKEGIPILKNKLPQIISEEKLPIPYLKKEVVDMLKWWRDKKNKYAGKTI